MKLLLRRYGAITTAITLFAITGCVNLDEVADLGKIADEMRVALPSVTADIPATCARQNALLNDTPEDERGNTHPADCKPFTGLAHHLNEDQAVLIAYLEALSKLASDKPLSYDKAIDTSVTAISGFSSLSTSVSTATTAAAKIAGALADAATRGYREKKINDLITATDAPLQQLTGALKQAVTVDYGLILSNEGDAIDSFYQGPIAARRGERLTLILVQRQYGNDKAALAKRQAAAVAYGKCMDDLASTHAKLAAAAARHASLTQIAKEIEPGVGTLKDSISDLIAAEK